MLILECSKSDYWGPAFVIPLVSILFVLILAIISLWKLALSCRSDEPLRKPILQAVFGITTLILLFVAHFPTFRYGIFLPMVSEDDVQCKQGCVTSVAQVPMSPRFSIQNSEETYRASLVEVDGDVFYFLSAEGLEAGQEIVVTYLPRCNMVLSCQLIGE